MEQNGFASSVRHAPPIWEPWEPAVAACEHRGREITTWELVAPSAHATTQRESYLQPNLPPRPLPRDVLPPDSLPFRGYSTTKADFGWPAPAGAAVCDRRCDVVESAEALAWPVVSYHGCVDIAERELRNAAIDAEERRAWRERAKVIPERALFHGEDEGRATGKPPLSRVFGYPSRPRSPPRPRKPPVRSSGYGAGAIADGVADCARRNARRARGAHVRVLPAKAQLPTSGSGGLRSRAEDFGATSAWWPSDEDGAERDAHRPVPGVAGADGNKQRGRPGGSARPFSVPLAGAPKRPVHDKHTLQTTAQWKYNLRERARTALPGGHRDVVLTARRAPEEGAWKRGHTCRAGPTGAANEPIPLGRAARPQARGGARNLAVWNTSKARAYK